MSSSFDPTKLATSTISQFDGTNYKKWSDVIRAFLRYQGVWYLIQGYGSTATVPVPGLARPIAATDTPTATEIAAQAAWDEKNDKALGIIQLYVAQNLRHLVDDKFLALDAWTAIKAGYEKPGAVGAFVNVAGIEVKPQLLALLMINALPKSYQTIAGTILTTQTDVTLLTAALIKPKIVEEEQRRVANRTQIARVSKAPLLDNKCEKCGRKNHTTEQHWDTKPVNSGSSSGNGNNTQQQQQDGGKRKKEKGKGKAKDNTAMTTQTVNTIRIVDSS
ncbi:uncharacterized protein PHACADRAFT_103520 [Phanerochaete carnosa HHB-10118-sp]|uniref:DUF4219 domain-containing protein n=1 Tax=Phanerochaete carnosa (strain HHB-10118-sp) TaxID=650164 RepID=K5VJ24_PHACS|nr:uncharacterized protein PHACADRAFT_103520 [Phanerochaete carnosa HHB-10118-sp]EKM51288.1 hypothetical protein PHACADRAFT_103520 [Phanerochaete carnosa HHB-10118-sp]